MFFSDWEAQNGQPGLERAFMDGTNRYGIIGSKLGWPAGITLDIEAKRIYWVDSRYDYIETATYDGLHRWIGYVLSLKNTQHVIVVEFTTKM